MLKLPLGVVLGGEVAGRTAFQTKCHTSAYHDGVTNA